MTEAVNHNEEIIEDLPIYSNFDSLNLKPELLQGIFSYGYEYPSAIQQKAIKPCIDRKDVIAQAQSGTGKTATFAISALQNIDIAKNDVQVLVLSPTRELAKQSNKVIMAIGDFLQIKSVLCVGGTNVQADIALLQQGQHIVVGTPGRVFDMMQRRALDTSYVTMFILDEADEMLSRGFNDQIYQIFQYLPKNVQIVLLSATMPIDVMDMANKFMNEPVKILVKQDSVTLQGIPQFYVMHDVESNKVDTLVELYKSLSVTQCVIFCNTRRKVEYIKDTLLSRSHVVAAIHGDMTQEERSQIMTQFRTGSARVLISTDLLSRGIDVQQVSLVINFEMPSSKEVYIHRIGRSGRFGRKGVAINLLIEDEAVKMRDIEKFYQTNITQMPQNIADLIK
ncbi:hypothetical protein A3Q56_02890 [Intoshia linei]|uniref:RNA helicase n=1 Tax=Intoshia linei TaxID=1819745 RepID=A0A177B7H7_9BILA|nr:hypothetical protein A3Q56_02890 [Intoshia linei]